MPLVRTTTKWKWNPYTLPSFRFAMPFPEPVLAPVVSVPAEVDEGPKFRIDGELDLEEHPTRLGRV